MSKARDISNLFSGSTSASTDAEVTAAISAHNTTANGHVKRGNTASRPASPTNGDIYANTQIGYLEYYNGTIWIPIGAPASVPTNVVATNQPSGRAFNNGQASVSFTVGDIAGTSYRVTSSPGSYTTTGAASPLIITGLQSSTQYTYTVNAINGFGTSDFSSASSAVTATTVPQAPTINSVTSGNTEVSVAFTAGATGGSAITGYTITSSPASTTTNQSASSSPYTFTGLTNGTAYTFTITATNTNGNSAASSASSSVTPVAPILVTALLVGGGGGGGVSLAGGGGGGAVMKTDSMTLVNGTTYNVVIGSGAVGPTTGASVHYTGGSTTFNGITCTGGGNGASRDMGATAYNNMSAGANGGGGTADGAPPSTLGKTGVAPTFPVGITGIVYAGYTGGNGNGSAPNYPGPGGAGSNQNGATPANSSSAGGAGGNGIQINFDGNNWYWAGGGGGSSYTGGNPGGNGGLGGGGGGASANTGGTGGGSSINSGQTPASGGGNYDANRTGGNGGANSGGGGGAGSHGEGDGGNGGSGICIIKTTSTASETTGSPTISSSEGYNYYRFTGTGSITF